MVYNNQKIWQLNIKKIGNSLSFQDFSISALSVEYLSQRSGSYQSYIDSFYHFFKTEL